jgi:Tol biopolymer transport system component
MPHELEEICFKALAKDLSERYQTAQEFSQDIRQVKKHLERVGEQTTVKQFNYADERKTELTRYRPTVSAEYIVTSVKRHKFLSFGALILLVFFGIGVGVYKFTALPQPVTSSFTASQKLNIIPFVTAGRTSNTVISPDGKYAAYVAADEGKQSIRLRQIATNSDVEIVTAAEKTRLFDLSFTPDGNYLYYIQSSKEDTTLFKVPTLGGTPTKISGNIDKYFYISTPAMVSPDGKKIAFYRDSEDEIIEDISSMHVANADGTDEQTLIKYSNPPKHLLDSIPGPHGHIIESLAWSPDGKTIAYGVSTDKEDGLHIKLLGINVSDSSQQQLSDADWLQINGMAWLPDGNLIVSGKMRPDSEYTPSQIWLVAPNSQPQPITNDLNGYSGVSVTAKGDVLMATQTKMPRDLWIVPNNDAFRAKQITSSGDVMGRVRWMPDGKIAFTSTASGNLDIWTMNLDGSNRKQLTANQGSDVISQVTADGRYIIFGKIVFLSNEWVSTSNIWRMDADGSNQKQLTNGLRDGSPRVSPDGKWVYYIERGDLGGSNANVCKISIDGGASVKLATTSSSSSIAVSPRTGLIAYLNTEGWGRGELPKLIILSPDDYKPIKTLTLPRTIDYRVIQWTPDERAIAFADNRNDRANIWSIPFNGQGEAKPLTNFTSEQTIHFDWSSDGKQLLVTRGRPTSQTVLITKAK